MMADAAEAVYPGYHYRGLQNYKLFKGLVFDGSEASDYLIDLNLLAEKEGVLTLEVKISSLNARGKTVFHYGAEVLLAKTKLATLHYEHPLPALSQGGYRMEKPLPLYQDGTLFHGESLQGIRDIIHCDQDGLLMACQLSDSAREKQGEFPLGKRNIFADDLVYQAMLVWVRNMLGMGSLPSSTLSWLQYEPVSLTEPFYLKLDVVEQKANTICADISLISPNPKGEGFNVLARVKSAQVTASENLKELFRGSRENKNG